MGIAVRRLEAGDWAAWQQLFEGYNAFYERLLPPGRAETAFAELLSDAAGTHVGFIAIQDGSAGVGIAHALHRRSTFSEAGYVYLEDLFTAPDARGKGVGRALIMAVYSYADALQATRTYWLTHETNAAGRRLYDRVAVASGFIQYRR